MPVRIHRAGVWLSSSSCTARAQTAPYCLAELFLTISCSVRHFHSFSLLVKLDFVWSLKWLSSEWKFHFLVLTFRILHKIALPDFCPSSFFHLNHVVYISFILPRWDLLLWKFYEFAIYILYCTLTICSSCSWDLLGTIVLIVSSDKEMLHIEQNSGIIWPVKTEKAPIEGR